MGLGQVAPRPAGGRPVIGRTGLRAALANERGGAIVLVAVSMTALLSVVALAVDLGMLFTARGEAQRVADAAALAGAGSLIPVPDDEDRARRVAMEYAALNAVRNEAVALEEGDVEVDLDDFTVTVTVRRQADRGNAVGTWFANVFGVGEVDVAANATAEAAPAGRAVCVKPFALFDRFDDVDGDGVYEPGDGDEYDPFEHGYGTPWRNHGSPGDDGEGYDNDRGRQVVLKGGGPKGGTPGTGPSWYYPWDVPQYDDDSSDGGKVCSGGPGGTGASCYRWAIENCHPAVVEVGEEYWVEDGNMHGPTETGIENLIDKDPGAYWDDSCQCVKGSKYGDAWEGSERIGIVPTFDPGREFEPGKKPIVFTNFVAVFFERVQGGGGAQKVYGRILYPSGVVGGDRRAPMLKAVRLIE